MRNWILGIASFFLGAALGFWAEVLMASTSLFLAILFTILAVVMFGVLGFLHLSEKVWPTRKGWWATSSYDDWVVSPQENPQNALSDNRGQIWRSPLPQELDAWFEIDMSKERMIASIEFLADNSGIEKPARWRMMFYGKGHRTLGHRDGEGFISVTDSQIPAYIQYSQVQIKEIADDMREDSNYAKRHGTKVFWTISFIRMKEYRFHIFGKRFWVHEL